MVGKMVSHYRIVEKLGEGGMGVVYKAEDTKLRRFVALKFLPGHVAADDEVQARFLQEARVASALDHPNIATIYDLERTEDSSFISMAYVDGQTLSQRLSSGPLDVDEAIDVAIAVAQGLTKAHKKGIVHRDIKSDNIMISRDGLVKITDFGLAKLVESSIRTKEGAVLGTPHYMSPEQAQSEEVDHRTDIFSLGVVLYEMVTGRFPFTGDRDLAVIYSVIHQEPTPVRELAPHVPPMLERIIAKTLQKNPKDRYQSMEALLEDMLTLKGDYDWRRRVRLRSAAVVRTVQARWAKLLPGGLIALLIFALFILVRGQISGSSKEIVVLPFTDMTEQRGYEEHAWTFAGALSSNLRQSKFLSVIPQIRIRDILRGMGREDEIPLDTITAKELCRLSGTEIAVVGGVRQVDGRLSVQVDLYQVEDWHLLFTATSTGEGEGDFWDLVEAIGFQIRRGLKVTQGAAGQAHEKTIELTTASPEAYGCFLEGERRIEDINMSEAARCFSEAVRFDSTFALAHAMLALIYYSQGQKQRAVAALEKAERFSEGKSDKERLLIRSYECMLRGDREGLLRSLGPLTKQCYDDIRVLTWVGDKYWSYGEIEKAIALFKRTIELDPERSYSYEALGALYTKRREWKRALRAYERQVEIAPYSANSYNSLGAFHLMRGDHDAAIRFLNEAESLRPGFSCYYLGRAFFARGQYDLAETYFQQALHLGQSVRFDSHSHAYLTFIYLDRGQFDRALAESRRAGQNGLNRPLACDTEGLVYLATGQLDSAAAMAEEIRQLDLQGPWSYHLFGLIDCQRGDVKSGLPFLSQALERLSPEDALWPRVHLALARALLQAGEPDRAEEHCRRIIDIWPGSAPAHFVLGLAYEGQGKMDKAVRAFQRVIDIWQEASENLPELKEAKEKIGRYRKEEV